MDPKQSTCHDPPMRTRVARTALIGLALVTGCGSGGGESDHDGGSAADATSMAPDAAPAGPVRLTDSKIFAQRAQSTQISFGLDAEGPGSCLSEIVAGCEVQTCEEGAGAVRASGGTVTLTSPLGEAVHMPDEGAIYPTTPAIDWEPGDAITLDVAGSEEIAAFDGMVSAPGSVTSVSAPALGEPLTVRRDEPLAFAWEGADAAVTGVVNCIPQQISQVRCRFPDGVMSAVIPAEALGRLPACAGNVYLLTEQRILTGPPGLIVRFAARGTIHSGAATIE